MRKIAIAGTSLTTRHLAPWEDKTWDIWTLGKNYKLPRSTRHYELHELAAGYARWSPQYIHWLETSAEVWLQKPHPAFASPNIFPIKEIVSRYGNYLTCQIALMIAHAVYEHDNGDTVSDVALYGCDLAQDSTMLEKNEYSWQRPSVEYWLGLCAGKGIKVTVPPGSDICKTSRIYAYEDEAFATLDHCIVQREEELNKRMAEMAGQIQQHEYHKAVLAGALENMKWVRHFIPPPYSVDDDSQLAINHRSQNGDSPNGSPDVGTPDASRFESTPAD